MSARIKVHNIGILNRKMTQHLKGLNVMEREKRNNSGSKYQTKKTKCEGDQ